VRNRYKAKSEFSKALKAAGIDQGKIVGWRNNFAEGDRRLDALVSFEKRVSEEEAANEADAIASRGHEIKYGAPIRLLHNYTGRLLTAIARASETAALSMRLVLEETGLVPRVQGEG
jgi:hypothetical protein